MDKELSIRVSDRIVYFGDEPCRGTVRWLGHIEDICSGITAGVELDEPLGNNNGAWAGESLFQCQKRHGIFINLAGLIKEDDFGGAKYDDDLDEVHYENIGAAKNADVRQRIQSDFESDQLFVRLKRAIADGQPDEAAELASKLARMYSSKKQKEKPHEEKKVWPEIRASDGKTKSNELRLDVEVEMKDSKTTEFQLSVPSYFTIHMLMKKVERDFGYEFDRQRWFFGEKMITDLSESVQQQNSLTPVLYIREKGAQLDAQKGASKITENPKANTDGKARTNKTTEEKPDPNAGWMCSSCTFVNEPTRPGCSMCTSPRPDDYVVKMELEEKYKKSCEKVEKAFLEKYAREARDNYEKYLELDECKVIPNKETFECKVCYAEIEPGEGIQLHECLHNFCRDCIKGTINNSEDIPIQCPYLDEDYNCQSVLQDREIANILSEEELGKYNSRLWAKAAGSTPNSYHCRTPDCEGWCEYEYGANEFLCPICGHTSCITCQVIHEGKNCKEYQDELKLNAQNNEDARKTQEKIAEMIVAGTAMDCPGCGIVIMKTEGCDGMTCSHCRIEICWATKGARWGPGGHGDLSGGCRCRAPPGHQLCHINCRNCH